MSDVIDVATQAIVGIDFFQEAGTDKKFIPVLPVMIPAFSGALQQLNGLLTEELLAVVRDRGLVQLGGVSARSYVELVEYIGSEWFRNLLVCSNVVSDDYLAWEYRDAWPSIDVKALVANWLTWCRKASKISKLEIREFHLAMGVEWEKLNSKPIATNSAGRGECRLSVHSDKEGDFVLFDGKGYQVNAAFAGLARAAIETKGDWVNMKTCGCRSRDLYGVPTPIKSWFEMSPGKGCRLKKEAWLS